MSRSDQPKAGSNGRKVSAREIIVRNSAGSASLKQTAQLTDHQCGSGCRSCRRITR